MPEQKPNTSRIRRAIVSFLIGNVDCPCISIANVFDSLRKTSPLDQHTDRELEDLIALIAVDAGFAIEFDGSARALKALHLDVPETGSRSASSRPASVSAVNQTPAGLSLLVRGLPLPPHDRGG